MVQDLVRITYSWWKVGEEARTKSIKDFMVHAIIVLVIMDKHDMDIIMNNYLSIKVILMSNKKIMITKA